MIMPRGIDDSSIMGNPFDQSKWSVEGRGSHWVALDALGNVIHTASTKEAADQWLQDLKDGKLADQG